VILIVDDEAENRSALSEILARDGHECLQAESAAVALQLLRDHREIQLLITDLKMPGMSGLELLALARSVRPDVQRLLVTAFGTIEDTVTAMKAGAFDVLTKPLKMKVVRETVARIVERAPKPTMSQVSPQYAHVMDLLRRAAQAQASVLLTGESGTGKSHLARLLHESSDRQKSPFVALNCAAIPSELLESELFGFEKGAFTGAVQAREGKIIAASGGTLLLDEIGDLSLPLQAKLLQFIQSKKFFRLGSNKEVLADVRVVAATNRKLEDLVNSGQFREDLLYRLRVVEIHVPPLRERKQDLLWLIPAILDSVSERNARPAVRLTLDAFQSLYRYDWPGNIRELENVLESALVLASREELQDGFLSTESFSDRLRSGSEPSSDKFTAIQDLATLEKNAIRHAFALTGGNRRLTAKLLGISERTLYRVLGSAELGTAGDSKAD
jgi:two-component system response regulator HydG